MLIRKIKGFLIKRKVKSEGGEAFSHTIRNIYIKKYNINIGYGSYGGCFDHRYIPPNTTFGNYCSVASGVKVFRANHPISYFSTHPLFYNPVMGYVEKDQLDRPELNVGHDVWIGENAIILPTVKVIGNGAIIGAGSVVTKDVQPYSVVAGNPARLIKMRFESEVIKRLEQSKWWMLNKEQLVNNKEELEDIINGK